LKQSLEASLREQLQVEFEQKWTQQSLAEGDAAQKLVAQRSARSRMAGLFLGVPIALLALVVGFLMVQSYFTFTARLETARQEVDAQLRQAQQERETLRSQLERIQPTSPRPATPAAAAETGDSGVSVHDEVEAALNQRLKDQKLVETEAAEAVVAKLSDWAKLFGFFVGIPLALFAVALGFFGVKSFADLSDLINGVQQSVTREFAQVQGRTALLRKETDTLRARAEAIRQEAEAVDAGYRKLKEQFADVSGLAAEVKTLSTKVDEIEKIAFEPSRALTPDLEKRLTALLASFQVYMQRTGFTSKGGVKVLLQDEAQSHGAIAYYDPAQNCMFVQAAYASDSDAVFRQYAHHVLLAHQDQAMQSHAYASIESGLAFYYPCSFNNNSKFGAESARIAGVSVGRPYIADLASQLSFDKAYEQMHPTQAGEVWGGALWELRDLLGKERADTMLFRAWTALKSDEMQGDDGKMFVRSILRQETELSLPADTASQIQSIFARRGVKA
jgi:hypothetical protein